MEHRNFEKAGPRSRRYPRGENSLGSQTRTCRHPEERISRRRISLRYGILGRVSIEERYVALLRMTARNGLAACVIARPELVTLQFRCVKTPSDGRHDIFDLLGDVCDTPTEKRGEASSDLPCRPVFALTLTEVHRPHKASAVIVDLFLQLENCVE
jgi:hypothetical protein